MWWIIPTSLFNYNLNTKYNYYNRNLKKIVGVLMYTGITLTYVNRTTPQQYAIVFNYFTKYDNI